MTSDLGDSTLCLRLFGLDPFLFLAEVLVVQEEDGKDTMLLTAPISQVADLGASLLQANRLLEDLTPHRLHYTWEGEGWGGGGSKIV